MAFRATHILVSSFTNDRSRKQTHKVSDLITSENQKEKHWHSFQNLTPRLPHRISLLELCQERGPGEGSNTKGWSVEAEPKNWMYSLPRGQWITRQPMYKPHQHCPYSLSEKTKSFWLSHTGAALPVCQSCAGSTTFYGFSGCWLQCSVSISYSSRYSGWHTGS